jgi:hypothetical protein
METAVQSEDPARSKSFELSLRTCQAHRNGLKLKLQGYPIPAPQLEKATDFHPGLFEVLTLDILAKETTND